MSSTGLYLKEIKYIKKVYTYEEKNISKGISTTKKNFIEDKNNTCYNIQKEETDMSFMILIYDGLCSYLGADSRITFDNNFYNDNFNKIFVNNDKTMAISSTGLSIKKINNIEINFPKEIADLCFSGLNIYDAINTKRVENKTYLDLLENYNISFFIIKKDSYPIICDIKDGIISLKLLKNVNFSIFVNGDYDNKKAIEKIEELIENNYFYEDAIKETIEDIIKETNKGTVSSIGGKVNTIML